MTRCQQATHPCELATSIHRLFIVYIQWAYVALAAIQCVQWHRYIRPSESCARWTGTSLFFYKKRYKSAGYRKRMTSSLM